MAEPQYIAICDHTFGHEYSTIHLDTQLEIHYKESMSKTCSRLMVRAAYPGITCTKPTKYVDTQGRPWCAIHQPDADAKVRAEAIANMLKEQK